MKGPRTRVRLTDRLIDIAEAQRGTLMLWVPVALGVGTAWYFTLLFEPGKAVLGGLAVLVIGGLVAVFLLPDRTRPPVIALVLVTLGFLNAAFSAHHKAAPVLGFHYYGPVTGRVVDLDRSGSDKPRLTLDQVVLARVSAAKTPDKVRISLHYPIVHADLHPGSRVMLTANLSPPSGPVEPGGFDFRRYAWFRGLGAIGYSRNPVLEFAPPDRGGLTMRLVSLRMQLARGIRDRIPGQNGAFAAAILTGDRSAIAPDLLAHLRASNLAHLLAISGLHMGLLTGFVFAALRYGIALWPWLALRLPLKKLAAVAAFAVASAYLALSGANVATQRAFVMVSVMLLAVLLDRRALTLRAVCLAGAIVLLVRPESLIEAGFQMSFAATMALVAVFAWLRDLGWFIGGGSLWRSFLRNGLALVLSSTIAGLATAPVSAFHFNQIAQYGLLANLASVPVMGMLVMPSAVIATLTAIIGLDAPFWAIMGAGIGWILKVATFVAGLDGAVRQVVKPEILILCLIGGGAAVGILFRGRLAWLAVIPVLAGFALWSQAERPPLLLSDNGRLMGVMTPEGRWLNRDKGSGFAAASWLENDGDAATQQAAALRTSKEGDFTGFAKAGYRLAYSWARDPVAEGQGGLCRGKTLLILPRAAPLPGQCVQITAADLSASGSMAVWVGKDGLKIRTARQSSGERLWSR